MQSIKTELVQCDDLFNKEESEYKNPETKKMNRA